MVEYQEQNSSANGSDSDDSSDEEKYYDEWETNVTEHHASYTENRYLDSGNLTDDLILRTSST